jgi:hypothetical protein
MAPGGLRSRFGNRGISTGGSRSGCRSAPRIQGRLVGIGTSSASDPRRVGRVAKAPGFRDGYRIRTDNSQKLSKSYRKAELRGGGCLALIAEPGLPCSPETGVRTTSGGPEEFPSLAETSLRQERAGALRDIDQLGRLGAGPHADPAPARFSGSRPCEVRRARPGCYPSVPTCPAEHRIERVNFDLAGLLLAYSASAAFAVAAAARQIPRWS